MYALSDELDYVPGLDEIAASFNLCSPLTDERSYRHLLGWIRNSFASITMFDYPYPTVFMAKMPGNPVKVRNGVSEGYVFLSPYQKNIIISKNVIQYPVYTEQNLSGS